MLPEPDTIAPQEGPSDGLNLSRRQWLRGTLGTALAYGLGSPSQAQPPSNQAIVLCYHRFADTVADSMTVRKATFGEHIKVIEDSGAHVVPLSDLIAFRQGKLAKLPPRAVVITVDDGHRTQIEVMAPMLAPTKWPVTLFIYPSAISNASYAMRWEQLKQMQAMGQYTIQSHTYWHPHFVKERRQQSPADFERFARTQLLRSKSVLEDRMGRAVTQLAWPFGIFDEGVMALAASLGYEASMALGNKPCAATDPMQALPRYLMVDEFSGKRLKQIIDTSFSTGAST